MRIFRHKTLDLNEIFNSHSRSITERFSMNTVKNSRANWRYFQWLWLFSAAWWECWTTSRVQVSQSISKSFLISLDLVMRTKLVLRRSILMYLGYTWNPTTCWLTEAGCIPFNVWFPVAKPVKTHHHIVAEVLHKWSSYNEGDSTQLDLEGCGGVLNRYTAAVCELYVFDLAFKKMEFVIACKKCRDDGILGTLCQATYRVSR